MAQFTPKVLRLLIDYLTGIEMRQIEALFEDNGITLGPVQDDRGDTSVRRSLVRRYLAGVNLNSIEGRAKLTDVLSDVMQEIGLRAKSGDDYYDLQPVMEKWTTTLKRAGFDVGEWTYAVTDRAAGLNAPSVSVAALAALDDPSAILDHLNRLAESVDTDPRLAVSTAKALIESTAKCVLSKRSIEYSRTAKIPALVNDAQTALSLTPKGVSEEDKSLRQVLQSLVSLTQGVTEIRNKVGVDHGAESVPTWVRPRHARLVVGAAQVWCTLMLETLADPGAPWRKA